MLSEIRTNQRNVNKNNIMKILVLKRVVYVYTTISIRVIWKNYNFASCFIEILFLKYHVIKGLIFRKLIIIKI